MKKIVYTCLTLAVLVIACTGGNDVTKQKEKLRNVLTQFYINLTSGDSVALRDFTTPDFVLYDQGKMYDAHNASASLPGAGTFSIQLSFDSLHAHFDKANASVYYVRQATFRWKDSSSAPQKFLESATFEKIDGDWKLRFLHSSRQQ